MAPVLSRTMATASLASLPPSSPFARASLLRSAFLPPQIGRDRKCFSPAAGLRWTQRRQGRRDGLAVRCEAAVAEKDEATGEKFEYQAEVGF